jgi:chaperonin GroES
MATPFNQAPQQGQPMQQSQMSPAQQPGAGQGMQGGMPQGQPSTQEMPQQGQYPGGSPYSTGQEPQQDSMSDIVDFALSEINLAKKLRNKKEGSTPVLEKMASQILEGYERDERSRQKWLDYTKEALDLALLVRKGKTWPWPKAANVKYPLISTAAMQFSARAYPALVPADGSLVKARVSAVDQQGALEEAAIRVSKHMSYQLTCDVPNWEEDMDKLLMTMAVTGICFKKTYYDSASDTVCSSLVYPENLCVNYWAKSLEGAYRKTELLYYTENDVRERVNNDEEFLDIDYGSPVAITPQDKPKQNITPSDEAASDVDKSTPFLFLACHTFWDLDGDGYEEPYVVTIHKETRKVVRIIARWDSDGVKRNPKNPKKIVCIKPVEYFTDFPFIPNPDGSIYALGFGTLLGPLNETVNTLINQLVDAGSMSSLQSGFIGRNLRLKEGQLQIRPNEWKVVNATGMDLKNSIFPLPTKEPSPVLFQLLDMLIKSGNELASIAEIFVGKMPGQNTPATTTQETIQQGMAVFTAIYKRVYRSLAKEFKKIFRINRITPDIINQESYIVGPIQQSDYDNTEHLIIPGADPAGDSRAMRQQKMQQVGQLMQMGTINPQAYTTRMLQDLEIPNYQELQAQPQPPAPDPKAETEKMKQQTLQMKAGIDQQRGQQELQNKQTLAGLKRQEEMDKVAANEQILRTQVAAKAMEAQHKATLSALQIGADKASKAIDLVFQTTKGQQQAQQGQMKMDQQDAQASRQMARDEQLHQQQMELQAQAAQAQQQQQNQGE